MNGHLGPLAAALVDEQLTGGEREKALRHVAACATCRSEVAQQRAMKLRLDGMDEPALPSALLDRLQAMRLPAPGQPPSDPVDAPTQGPPRPAPVGLGPVSPGPLSMPGATPGRPLSAGSRVLPFGSPVALAAVPAVAGPSRVVTRSRVRRVLLGATSLVLLGGGAAYAAGGSSDQSGTPVRPTVDVYTVQHGTTSGTVPLHDPAVTAVTVGLGR